MPEILEIDLGEGQQFKFDVDTLLAVDSSWTATGDGAIRDLVGIPAQYWSVAKAARAASELVDGLESQLRSRKATADSTFRAECSRTGQKVTEAAVSAYVDRDLGVKSIQDAMAVARGNVAKLSALLTCIDKKQSVLDKAVRLRAIEARLSENS